MLSHLLPLFLIYPIIATVTEGTVTNKIQFVPRPYGFITQKDELELRDPMYQAPFSVQNPRRRKHGDCTDERIRKIMHESMSEEGMTSSRKSIHSEVTAEYEGTWSIVCAHCAFSYLAHTDDYCIHSRYGITCLVYKISE